MYNTEKNSILKTKQIRHKKNRLRYYEYYDMQGILDTLYSQSKQSSKFKNLYDIITSKNNIMLAYRTIKRNNGSKTPGVNKHNIRFIESLGIEQFITYIQNRFKNYQPQQIKRVDIPKANGKVRQLGIPCIEDRIIQQCIKQVLEPICEAKFHHHSYGFRPNRSTENAIAYMYKKINLDKCYYVVDIDIKGFFDNVNHGKLLKQLWSIGIQDKRLISIISKMLKAEIFKVGIPNKGVPQGGILSPLLSNVVLNELDWWLSNQWETYETEYKYSENYVKYKTLRRNSNLKEFYFVRYADDFKIFCKDLETANKIFIATNKWLQERLNLEISPEKSNITDVRKEYSEFLGFKIKAHLSNNKWVVKSYMSDKAKEATLQTIKNQIYYVQKYPNNLTVYTLNRIIVGLQNYYNIATEIYKDFAEIDYKLRTCLKNRFKFIRTKTGYKSEEYKKRYKNFTGKVTYILRVAIYPISSIKTSYPKVCKQETCNYTKEGRELIHTKLGYINTEMLKYLTKNPIIAQSVECNDNRVSLYSAQKGQCRITGLPLDETMEIHHITPIKNGGTDEYRNLILVTYDIHKFIHAIQKDTINYYMNKLNLNKIELNKLNKYRIKCGNEIIVNE